MFVCVFVHMCWCVCVFGGIAISNQNCYQQSELLSAAARASFSPIGHSKMCVWVGEWVSACVSVCVCEQVRARGVCACVFVRVCVCFVLSLISSGSE